VGRFDITHGFFIFGNHPATSLNVGNSEGQNVEKNSSWK
jgi:hypothetical protein